MKLSLWVSVLLGMLCFSSVSYAMGPRLVYVEPSSSSESLMGRYLYMGAIFADDNPAGFAGSTIKVGVGKTGNKLNIGYMAGSRSMSLEVGASYIKQDADAGLWINNERKGYAFEAAFRINAVSIIGVFTKDNTSIEFGLGF